jgi:phenylacetate-CoA ligase
MLCTPVQPWLARRLKVTEQQLNLERLRNYQLRQLNRTLALAADQSPFYRERLQPWCTQPLSDLSELAKLPFTTPEELRSQGMQMLATSQSAIERVVTLESSGTTGSPKRLWFTAEDLARTQEFFRCGMSQVLQPGYRVLILLPGELPDSAGDLLARALAAMGVESRIAGLVLDAGRWADVLAREPFDCVVGIPWQVLAVLRHPLAQFVPRGRIKSVFLTSDYVPKPLVAEIRKRWDCPAFNHYGMTEFALSGGVECLALDGYHLREADFLFEVIDPDSGRPLPPGQLGEVVFTTLDRRGMPLIRYRTGDLSYWHPEACPCGSFLPRLAKIHGRLAARRELDKGLSLQMPDLDEILLPVPGLRNYTASLTRQDNTCTLQLILEAAPGREPSTLWAVERLLPEIPAVRAALDRKCLQVLPPQLAGAPLPVSATVKRSVQSN